MMLAMCDVREGQNGPLIRIPSPGSLGSVVIGSWTANLDVYLWYCPVLYCTNVRSRVFWCDTAANPPKTVASESNAIHQQLAYWCICSQRLSF